MTLNRAAMDDRHAPKLYSRFLLGLVKQGEKILARGSQVGTVSTASSPASLSQVGMGTGVGVSSGVGAGMGMGMGMGNDMDGSPGGYQHGEFEGAGDGMGGMSGGGGMGVGLGVDPNFGQYTAGIGAPLNTYVPQQQQQQQYMLNVSPTAQQPQAPQQAHNQAQMFSFDDSSAFGTMDDIQSSLPQNSWPHPAGTGQGGSEDTLMPMQLFGDQFWEDGLVSLYFLIASSSSTFPFPLSSDLDLASLPIPIFECATN